MADTEAKAENGEGTKRRGSILPIVIAGVVGLTGGGAAGLKLVGPALAPVLAARSAPAAERADGGQGEGEEGQEGAAFHVIDNLVVNPARSGGARLLLTSIAVETSSAEAAARMKMFDVALRDALIVVLGGKTVDELTDIPMREQISGELFAALERVMGEGTVRRIFIPQFVVQ